MKNLLFICLALIAIWQFLNRNEAATRIENSVPVVTQASLSQPIKKTTQFKCDGRQYCSDMRSYEEAKFFIQNCPNTKMDGDGDGIPCERQFGK